jgi:hypothetical protein
MHDTFGRCKLTVYFRVYGLGFRVYGLVRCKFTVYFRV